MTCNVLMGTLNSTHSPLCLSFCCVLSSCVVAVSSKSRPDRRVERLDAVGNTHLSPDWSQQDLADLHADQGDGLVVPVPVRLRSFLLLLQQGRLHAAPSSHGTFSGIFVCKPRAANLTVARNHQYIFVLSYDLQRRCGTGFQEAWQPSQGAYSGQRQSWKTPSELEVSKSVESDTFSLQCSDTVGWATERTSLSVLTAIFQVNPGQPVFNEAKDDGGGGDNWTTGAISRAKLCSQIITTNKPTSSFFYRPDALPVTQPTVSKH